MHCPSWDDAFVSSIRVYFYIILYYIILILVIVYKLCIIVYLYELWHLLSVL